MAAAETFYASVRDEVGTVLVGNEDTVRHLTIALLTGGHVLMEGVPGVGKTTIANTFSRALGLEYSRIQMTPDILPADITGTHVYVERTGEFRLQRGPVFANMVLADEINRATPKSQSALLQAMRERIVTIEGETVALPDPFMVIATQNPVEMEGTFELPEAQKDRFQMKLMINLPTDEEERGILDRFDSDPDLGPKDVQPVTDHETLDRAKEEVSRTYVDAKVKEYIVRLVRATRSHRHVELGASPQASLSILNSSKALAAVEGRSYVIPDDVKALIHPLLNHRIILTSEAELSNVTVREVVQDIASSVEAPTPVEAP